MADPFPDGIQRTWLDAHDEEHHTAEATVAQVLAIMGEPPDDLETTAPVVTRRGRRTALHGTVELEDGGTARLDDVVADDLPFGYHRLVPDDGPGRRLIVSPGHCWTPEEQLWGWSVQLYATRASADAAGVGDLRDLQWLREWTQQLGGGFLVVNPLHAVAPVLPLEASPYLPASRRFRNPVYLHVEPPLVRTDEHAPVTVDRDAAWTHKLGVLRQRFDADGVPREFTAWRAEQGADLEQFALWSVLATEHGADWHDWPAALHDVDGPAARAAAVERADEVTFHAWLQWLLAVQLDEATRGLTVVQDLPIGVSGGGADAWLWREVMAHGVTVGAPPDALNTVGQDWGSPPFVPWRLRAADYEPFVQSVRATIAGAGGLRIDHVMGLFRLWWVLPGSSPVDGCYVRYPADDLLDIVCLESHRARAVVVGEDLGTVEEGVTEALAERGILGYRVLWFEDDDPATWPEGSLATVTTHDLPTVVGLWDGSDVDDQLAASDMDPADVRAGRAELLARLRRDGLRADASPAEAVAEAYRLLGRSPSRLLAFSLEDAVGEPRRPNVPGTTERDNWRVPLPVPLDALRDHPGPHALLAAAGVATEPAADGA